MLGQVAGWRSTPQGGAANYLCMPLEPLYSKPPTPGYHSTTTLFGVEYGHVEDLFARFPGRGPEISYHGVPCAVCRVEQRGSLMMIPARNVCPSRLWTREYHGYLMTDTSNSTRPEYICVDADATGANVIQKRRLARKALLASVKGQCGVLPCSKYRQDWELTCAVCTMWRANTWRNSLLGMRHEEKLHSFPLATITTQFEKLVFEQPRVKFTPTILFDQFLLNLGSKMVHTKEWNNYNIKAKKANKSMFANK